MGVEWNLPLLLLYLYLYLCITCITLYFGFCLLLLFSCICIFQCCVECWVVVYLCYRSVCQTNPQGTLASKYCDSHFGENHNKMIRKYSPLLSLTRPVSWPQCMSSNCKQMMTLKIMINDSWLATAYRYWFLLLLVMVDDQSIRNICRFINIFVKHSRFGSDAFFEGVKLPEIWPNCYSGFVIWIENTF